MRKISYLFILAVIGLSACKESFKKGDEGLEYKIISDGKGELIKYGNFIQIHISQFYNTGKKDSLLTDTRQNIPIIELLDSLTTPPAYFKILKQLRKGDSLVIRVLSDSAFKKSPENMPPFIKKGHYLLTTVKVANVFTSREQVDSARNAEMAAGQLRSEAMSAEQLKKDDKTLTNFFVKNNIQAMKAPLGTYIQIIQPGSGNNIDTSVVVKTNYTGKTMDGKTFDSNTDPAFNHMQPLMVNMTSDPALGVSVIRGWNDGLKLLNKGAKAKFYIPSSLAYGAQGAGADIAPNSILVFDIEVLDILNRPQALKEIEDQNRKMQAMQKHFSDSIAKMQADTSRK